MKGLFPGAFALCMAVACATASAREWAVVDGEVVTQADPNRYSVQIVSVDGTADFEAPTMKTLSPGFHYIQLASTRQDRRGGVTYVPYAFVAEPCTRYEVYAQYESALDRSPWQLVIARSPKPLGGCKPKRVEPAATTQTTATAGPSLDPAHPQPPGTTRTDDAHATPPPPTETP